jgi:hypothetical protein
MPNGSTRPEKLDGNWQRGFWSLIATQFQGAFNENGLKQLVIFLILAMGLERAERDRLVLIVGALFSIPFILFSLTGGFIALANARSPSRPSGWKFSSCYWRLRA